MLSSLALILFGCSENRTSKALPEDLASTKVEYYGNTQGTTFAVICNDPIELSFEEIEATLHNFDMALSSWIDSSTISNFNNASSGKFVYDDPYNYFNRCNLSAREMCDQTNGNFDPTLFPIIYAWGFYSKSNTLLDSNEVDSLLAFTGMRRGHFNFLTDIDSNDVLYCKNEIVKLTPQLKLDFNGIAQGLSVDILAELIESKGGKNYYVEIGGEIRVSGTNSEGVNWRIGIDKPFEGSNRENREITEIIHLTDVSVATSGSYRNFFESDGKTYSHTINPKTGYPVKHKLISATVVTEECAEADALATACMVMGPEKSISFFQKDSVLDAEIYLIFENKKGRVETYFSPGFEKYLQP